MTRYQAIVAGDGNLTSGSANNVGSLVLIQQRGRIRAVQFSLTPVQDPGDTGLASSIIQVSKSAAYTSPSPFNGSNPTEIASTIIALVTNATAGDASYNAVPVEASVMADMPVTEGEQVFVNVSNLQGALNLQSVCGLITIFVE